MENESTKSRGIGSFFFAAIPGILGAGAVLWLLFVTGVVDFHRQEILQGRMDNRVGVVEPLKEPVKLIVEDEYCVKITKAFLDGDSLTAYMTSGCHEYLDYWELHWEVKSPDGTILDSGYDNTAFLPPLHAGEKAEHVFSLPSDSRTNTVVVWTSRR